MKGTKDFRGKGHDQASEDVLKKAVKLAPIKKSGKEKHMLYSGFDEEEDEELISYSKKESVLDYFDDDEDE